MVREVDGELTAVPLTEAFAEATALADALECSITNYSADLSIVKTSEPGFYAEVGVTSLALIAVSTVLTWLFVVRPQVSGLT